tara:strand:- start:196 stop:603 length:408 start_codon:yes stop_codon:yes gene_type:complete
MGLETHFKPIGNKTVTANTPFVAAATATENHPLLLCEYDMELVEVEILTATTVTGANTNTKHLNLEDSTTEIATRDLVSGTDLAVGETQLFDGTSSERFMSLADYLSVEIELIGTGIDIPPLAFVITYRAANLSS